MKSTQTNQFLYKYQLKHQQSDISKAEESGVPNSKNKTLTRKMYTIKSIQLP